MKKILSILLAVMMAASVFAGCSKEPDANEAPENSGESEIIVESLNKTFTAIIYDDGESEEYWNATKTAFETANPGVNINMIISEDAAYEVRDRILAGNSPDFVYLPSDEESGVTAALIKDKAMTDLTDVEESGFAPAKAFENSLCKPYGDGKAYLAPIFFETKGLIYNIELLEKNGFSVPETWDDFIAIAKACDNKDFEFFTYAGAEPDEFVDIFAAALVSSIGTDGMNDLLQYDEEAWKNEIITEFAEKIEEVKKLVVSGSSTKSKDDTLECLKDGEALFISGSSEDLEELNADGTKYAICAYPTLSGEQTNIVSFGEMYIPIEAKEPELAKDFMEYIYFSFSASSEYSFNIGGFAAEFAEKAANNQSLADEFCALVVDVFKGNVSADEFGEKMLEYIEEY